MSTDFRPGAPRPHVLPYSGRAADPRPLAIAAQILVGLQSALQIVLGFAGGTRSDTFRTLTPLSVPLFIATVAVFLSWFRLCRRNAEVFAPGTQRHSQGFAVGAWFIPLIMWWMPRRIALDIWRAGGPAAGTERGSGGTWLVEAWWVAWLAKTIGPSAALYFLGNGFDPYSPFGQITSAVAGVLAILFIHRLTARQHARATEPLAAAPFPSPFA
ncbi:DUF4328 domain-containing protein [Kitasatospora sp. NPDC051170]|uniref:DUF4328 domain-containing protein n=1 Tax=Kitasatospora sp. NPDC051170 TaxID=3364056 RepID=UPI0037ACA27B